MSPSAEDRLELARDGIEHWNRGDVEAILEMSTPDFEFVPAIAGSVDGGRVIGEDAVRRFFSGLDETWETFEIASGELNAVDTRVVVDGRVRAIGRGSGVTIDQRFAFVFWFRDDKLARVQSFLDHDAALVAAQEATR